MLSRFVYAFGHGTHTRTRDLTWRSQVGAVTVMVGLVIGSVSIAAGATPAAASVEPTGWTRVSADYDHTCALTDTGAAWCWGANGTRQLVEVPGGKTWSQISVGNSHTCAINTTGSAWCWGSNTDGELGNGDTGPTSEMPVKVSGGKTWTQISAGDSFSCGIDTTGSAWCWGYNQSGQLGNGNAGSKSAEPVEVSGGKTWIQISATSDYTCGIDSTRAAWCWGHNGPFGMLGSGTTMTASDIPVEVSGGTTWSQISAGVSHACGIDTTGVAQCWGFNSYGQIGDGSSSMSSPVPAEVSGNKTWSQITAGAFHTCAIEMNTAAAWCWGYNFSSQLGHGDAATTSRVPLPVSGAKSWSKISAGAYHTCGIEATTTEMWCWGHNDNWALGNDHAGAESAVPVAVAGPPATTTTTPATTTTTTTTIPPATTTTPAMSFTGMPAPPPTTQRPAPPVAPTPTAVATLSVTGAPIGPAIGGAMILIGFGAVLIAADHIRRRRPFRE